MKSKNKKLNGTIHHVDLDCGFEVSQINPLTARWLPIHTQAVRVRAMYAIGSAHSVGVGLEADVW